MQGQRWGSLALDLGAMVAEWAERGKMLQDNAIIIHAHTHTCTLEAHVMSTLKIMIIMALDMTCIPGRQHHFSRIYTQWSHAGF